MLNQLTPEAGQYLKPVLEWTKNFMEEGLIDSAIAQMRTAVQQVMIGNMTVEQAADNYGNFK